MPIGDVIFQTVKIGQLDLIKSDAYYHGIDIYEDINDPFSSPLIELNVIDPIDALNKYKITGSYDDNEVEIKFKYEPTGEIVKFTGKMYSNEYLMNKMGDRNEGSGHSKSYQIRAVQPEFFRSQGKSIEKSFSGPNTRHVEDIFKMVSDKDIETLSPAEHRDKTFARVRPFDAVQSLIQEHSSPTYKSSAYTVFQQWKNGEPKIVQTTYEQLLEQSPVVTLKERTDLNSPGVSEQDQQNSIMFAQYSPSWSEPRALSKTVKKSFNHSTHQVVDQSYQGDTTTKSPAYKQPASYADPVDYKTAEDTFNNSTPHTSSDAKRRRAQFLAHLSQGNAIIEIPGNPKITLGSMINIEVPKKTDNLESGGEGQFNKKALVVAIRHKIKPAGQSPRYTMVLELVKGGMEQGGETA